MHRLWAACLAVSLGVLIISGCGELPGSKFDTYDEAVASAAAADWLKSFLPESATNIYLSSDLETAHTWLVFDFPPEALEGVSANCTPVSFDQVDLPDSSPRWWDGQALRDPWNAFYVCQDASGLGYLAVMGSGEQAYYWSYR